MSLWCHRFDQNSNENIVRISALKFFKASFGLPGSFLGLPVSLLMILLTKSPGSPQEATKITFQKSLQYSHCYFGQNDDTKKTFRN